MSEPRCIHACALCQQMDAKIESEPPAQGCVHGEQEPHSCPFKSDVHNDSETLCTCCLECQRDCADDI